LTRIPGRRVDTVVVQVWPVVVPQTGRFVSHKRSSGLCPNDRSGGWLGGLRLAARTRVIDAFFVSQASGRGAKSSRRPPRARPIAAWASRSSQTLMGKSSDINKALTNEFA